MYESIVIYFHMFSEIQIYIYINYCSSFKKISKKSTIIGSFKAPSLNSVNSYNNNKKLIIL